MRQSRAESLVESTLNTGSGFILSIVIASFTFEYAGHVGVDTPLLWAFVSTGIHTVVSIVRNYFWRRFFAAEVHKRVHKWYTNRR